MSSLSSCSLSSKLKKAEKKYEAGEYKAAADAYRKTIRRIPKKKRPLKAEVNYKVGYCYSHINAHDKAARAYRSALKMQYDDPIIYLNMAKSQHAIGNYKDARKNYARYLKRNPHSEEAQNGLTAMDSIADWNKHKTRHKISIPKEFNHRRASSCALMFMGEDSESVVITSNRVKGKKKVNSAITGVPNNDIFITRKNKTGKWEDVEPMEDVINTEHDEGVPSFSPDGKTMYFTRCQNDYAAAKIFKSQRSGGEWTEPVFVELFNDSSFSAAHPAITPEGDIMYLVSDCDAGFGGCDIWYSIFSDGKWGEPINAGPDINTEGDETFPYVDRKGTLYFSSNGHPGYGALDLFSAVKDSIESWTVQNMKAPFNSRFDDFAIVFEANSNNGYFSSNRKQRRFIDQIYRFDLPEMYFNITGNIVNDRNEELADGTIRLVGDNGENVKIRTKKNGAYKIKLSRNVKYVMMASHKGYLNSSHILNTNNLADSKEFSNDFTLSSLTKSVKMDNIFYEFGKWTLTADSEAGLQYLVKMLQDNPNIVMELAAHTDMVGLDKSNIELSQKRAQAVVDYLIAAGIESDRVVPKGYGETKPSVVDEHTASQYKFLSIGDILNEEFILALPDEQQEICNMINRRTEFKVIRTTYNLY